MSNERDGAGDQFEAFCNSGALAHVETAAWAAKLMNLRPSRRMALAMREPRSRTLEVLTLLLDQAHVLLDQKPRRALRITTVVREIAEHVAFGPTEYAAAFRARTLKEHAHALRIVRGPRVALGAIKRAAGLLAGDANYAVERADITLVEAIIHCDLGEYSAALCGINAASAVYYACGDAARQNKALQVEAFLHYNLKQYRKAQEVYRRSLQAGRQNGDAEAVARSLSNLAVCATQLRDFAAATELFPQAIAALEELGMTAEVQRAKLGYADALASQQGVEEAILSLDETRRDFLARGMQLDAAEVSLKMAEMLVDGGQGQLMSQMFADLVNVFTSAGKVQEALMAAAYLQEDLDADGPAGDGRADGASAVTTREMDGVDLEAIVPALVQSTGLPESDVRRHLDLLAAAGAGREGDSQLQEARERMLEMASQGRYTIVESSIYRQSLEQLAGIPGVDLALKTMLEVLRWEPYRSPFVSEGVRLRVIHVAGSAVSPALRLVYSVTSDERVRLLQLSLWDASEL
ncbi:MAG TPA: tetratricopeptide repeat protein [Thermoanaerobaculia bacterium]|jgi:tetratricopeptide (TPR) repeat protein